MFGKNKFAPIAAEFIGTALLSSVVLAVAVRTNASFNIAAFAGLTLGLMVLVIGPISGSHINPIVTIGLWTLKKIETSRAIMYICAQMLGGFAAWQVNETLINQSLRNIAGKQFNWHVLAAEAIGAAIFTFAVSSAVMGEHDQNKTAVVAGIGLALGISVSSLVSNGVINPAVAVGIQSWSFAYVVGPILGSVIGMNSYAWFFSSAETSKKVTARATAKSSSRSRAPRKKK